LVLSEGIFNFFSKGLEELNESLDGSGISSGGGEGSDLSKYGLEHLGLSELDGVSNEVGRDLTELDEGSINGDVSTEVKSIIDGVDGIVEGDVSLVEVGGLLSSDVIDQVEVLFGLGEGISVSVELRVRLVSLQVTGLQLTIGGSQGDGGVLDFNGSVGEFSITLTLLSSIDVIVVNLFLVYGVLELLKDVLDGVKG